MDDSPTGSHTWHAWTMFHGVLDVHTTSPSPGGRAKVDVPYLVSDLNQITTFKWYVVRCGSKDGY